MKVNGIIAEYNPFHNGHKYQLENAREATGADYTIVVMSGNFVQRGTPALINKFKRTEMALRNGADLVLELPMYYAASSAEYFATGAVSLLDKLHVTDNLCFGSECGDVTVLEKIAEILTAEPEEFVSALRHNMQQGLSYPIARTQALIEYNPAFAEYYDLFSSPNNILGIEYLKALIRRKSPITPYTTMRKGAGYNDKSVSAEQCSALAIRQAVFSGINSGIHQQEKTSPENVIPKSAGSKNTLQGTNTMLQHIPQSAYDILTSCLTDNTILQPNDFSAVLHYKLLSECNNGFKKYLDVSPELSDRIIKNLYKFESFTGFCDLLKSKDMTYTRISRCLLHILLDMTADTMEHYKAMDYIPYARVLGFRRDAAPLLTAIKQNSEIPLITKLADAEKLLTADSWDMLKDDICRNMIYESATALKSGQAMLNEYQTPIVIV